MYHHTHTYTHHHHSRRRYYYQQHRQHRNCILNEWLR